MTATITIPKSKKSAPASKQQSPYKRLHVIIPIEDMLWASQQKPSVTQLWQECWTADPYGSRWMPLTSALGYSTFISAKKILSESGLFIFKPDKSIQDGRETIRWTVKNLHGSRMKEFWDKTNAENKEPNSEKQESNPENTEMNSGSEEMRCLNKASILGKSPSDQGFQNLSRTVQEHFTNSTKEFVKCISVTLTKNLREEETAIAPLGVASPQFVEDMSEIEVDLTTATDCALLMLVDAVQGESASLLAGNQNLGGEVKDCLVCAASRREGDYSTAPVAENKFSSSSAIANKAPELVELSQPASFLAENQNCGVDPKDCHENEDSVAPAPNSEKWSSEVIAARSKARPGRLEKLKIAATLKENPGFEYLQECWGDDPILQIVIKNLLAKFPKWGFTIVDGNLKT